MARWSRKFSTFEAMNVFDRGMKRVQKDIAALSPTSRNFDYLRNEVAARVLDRVMDLKTKRFETVVDIGANTGNIRHQIRGFHVENLIQLELSEKMIKRDILVAPPVDVRNSVCIVGDEENIPLKPESANLVLSSMSLHWVNDLPGVLSQIKQVLKPDGVFIGAMLGGATLQELRSAFTIADIERTGGVSPHISPMAHVRDGGALLQDAGFALPAVDTEMLTVRYPDMFTLMDHLQRMGEGHVAHARAPAVSRDVFLAAASAYQEMYADDEGLIPATFEIIYLIGWSPHSSQPKPKERGSAKVHLQSLVLPEEQMTKTKSS